MVEPQLNQGVDSNYDLSCETLFDIRYWDQNAYGNNVRRVPSRDQTTFGGDEKGGPNPFGYTLGVN